ncbi:MAG: hypothetical protein KAJ58_00220 [Candidatus Pacebacteria bacterium]|nr:hypothetical protein [Candidatus Paceibacterota bacterium]
MENEISWEAFEYEFNPKSNNWFWVIWILALGLSVMFYLLGNIVFGILILVAVFSISVFASRKPDLMIIRLNSKKIIIKNKEIDLDDLESFWIENQKILFKSLKKLSPYIIIPLSSRADVEEIRDYLLEYLEEEELHESILQIFLEKIWS